MQSVTLQNLLGEFCRGGGGGEFVLEPSKYSQWPELCISGILAALMFAER